MKRVLVTAGPVYGRLDDNKIVSNRARGTWATRLAGHLAGRGHRVTLLVPDTAILDQPPVTTSFGEPPDCPSVVRHAGFDDYRHSCLELARASDAAVMAAAVTNWIPARPIPGKMATAGHDPGDVVDVPFVLAPRVVDEVKHANPRLTLIGCKMLVGSTDDELVEAARVVQHRARCNAVVANDLRRLRRKLLVFPDRSVHVHDDDFGGFFDALAAVVEDEYYETCWTRTDHPVADDEDGLFARIMERWRHRFVPVDGHAHGSLFIPTGDVALGIASPRRKDATFGIEDCVVVEGIDGRTVHVDGPSKATLNAPLLARVAQAYPEAAAVLHLHEQLPGVPTVPHAPPGTARDNERPIPGPTFNIEGHGFVAAVDRDGGPWRLE